jgi:transcriptional regulator with XRE-family HTH domain
MSARELGNRLRAAREARGLVLQEVEARSDREFKASVLGAYERGDRTISAPRLVRLAQIYDISPEELLSGTEPVDIDLPIEEEADAASASEARRRHSLVATSREPIAIDLTRSDHPLGPEELALMVKNFIQDVRSSRESRSVYELRESDVDFLAAAGGCKPSVIRDLVHELAALHRNSARSRFL